MNKTFLGTSNEVAMMGLFRQMAANMTDGLAVIAVQLTRIADSQEALVEATDRLARATAGEFDEAEEVPTPGAKGSGMGMQG